MPAENGESSPNPDKNRNEINRVKSLIKQDNLLNREHSYDSPGPNDIDNKERELIISFGLQGVETVNDLFNRTQAPGYNPEIAKEKLEILATAVYESMVEEGMRERVIAGSFTVKKYLPVQFIGNDKNNESTPSFAFMVAEKFRENFEAGQKRDEVTSALEYLDFIKNSEYSNNGGLELEVNRIIDSLSKFRPNVLNSKEMDAYAATVKYVSSLRREKNSGNRGDATVGDSAKSLELVVSEMAQLVELQKGLQSRFGLSQTELENSLDDDQISELIDPGDKDNTKIVELLKKQSANVPLASVLLQIKAMNREKNRSHERSEWPEGGVSDIYKLLDFIEKGSSNVDDLSRNSDFYRVLYKTQMGNFDNRIIGEEYEGRVLDRKDVETLKTEISERMFLHNFNLAASKCKSIEDILRTLSVMHEGDDGTTDKDFASFFLKAGGTGLRKLPIDMAWNLRQGGYFKIEAFKKGIESDDNFLTYLKGDTDEAKEFREEMEKKDLGLLKHILNFGLKDVIELKAEIPADSYYGIEKDINKNFLLKEISDNGEAKLIKEYMLWFISKARNVSRTDAEKAFELAKKFSRATFSDSKANITFKNDDYSELILFKYLRYSDGPKHDEGKQGKSKGIGSAYTIKHVESLCCNWMDLSRKTKDIREIYSPLFAGEIDFDQMTKKGMVYHFGGVVASQVLPVQEAFYDKIGPKDVLSFNYLNKLFAKINKTTGDMCAAGIKPIYYKNKAEEARTYFDLGSHKSQARVMETMRRAWVLNLLYLVGDNSSGWTQDNLKNLISKLEYNTMIYDYNGRPGASFIDTEYIRDAIKRTRVYTKVTDNDIEAERRKRRNVF